MHPINTMIHVARIFTDRGDRYLFLRQMNPHTFTWFEQLDEKSETETPFTAQTIEDAIRLAVETWKGSYFRTVICGFRYTLPERDEHGINALFCQMAASYKSSNGIYFDEELGCNCFVQNASDEARKIWKLLLANEKKS
jgi:hypothetical protein